MTYKTGNHEFNNYVQRRIARHGAEFSDETLSAKFAQYFGQRIEVRSPWGQIHRGWVGGTTGWKPSLMLLKLRTSSGSSELIDDRWEFVRLLDKGPR